VIALIVSTLKQVGAPGSYGFLVLCSAMGFLLIHVWRRPILGRAWLFAIISVYLVLATPVAALHIADALTQYRPVPELTRLPIVDVVITFGGDNLRGRARETLRVFAAWPSARIVLFGDDWLRDQLLAGGIPPGQISHDPRPPNTIEQMVAVRDYVRTHPHEATAVVASRLQMPRIAAIADTMRLHITLLPSAADVEPPRAGPDRWLPRYTALRISRDAIYEYAALIYYRWKGFTQTDRNPLSG
jgi:uncharacterized SAM-binding protein YcdF (DUF218 family)